MDWSKVEPEGKGDKVGPLPPFKAIFFDSVNLLLSRIFGLSR